MNRFTLVAVCLALPTSALSDQVFTETVIVDGPQLCVGNDCESGESFIAGREGIKLNANNLSIVFDDNSDGLFPAQDWHLEINSNVSGGDDFFRLREFPTGGVPFTVMAGAGDDALFISSSGNVGIGTNMPSEDLHIRAQDAAAVRLESTEPQADAWDVSANEEFFFVQNHTRGISPFFLANDAPGSSIVVIETGNVGLGTSNPVAPLELSRAEAFTFFRLTATQAAVNQSVDITFTGGPLGTGQLRYNIVDGDTQEMSLDADGNMVLDGTLTTAGPTCASGCDRVFEAGYALMDIKDRAALTAQMGYLPALGPTQPHAPINVTEKLAGVINELEHAHLYIAELQDQITAQNQVVSRQADEMQAVLSRLSLLEMH